MQAPELACTFLRQGLRAACVFLSAETCGGSPSHHLPGQIASDKRGMDVRWWDRQVLQIVKVRHGNGSDVAVISGQQDILHDPCPYQDHSCYAAPRLNSTQLGSLIVLNLAPPNTCHSSSSCPSYLHSIDNHFCLATRANAWCRPSKMCQWRRKTHSRGFTAAVGNGCLHIVERAESCLR